MSVNPFTGSNFKHVEISRTQLRVEFVIAPFFMEKKDSFNLGDLLSTSFSSCYFGIYFALSPLTLEV